MRKQEKYVILCQASHLDAAWKIWPWSSVWMPLVACCLFEETRTKKKIEHQVERRTSGIGRTKWYMEQHCLSRIEQRGNGLMEAVLRCCLEGDEGRGEGGGTASCNREMGKSMLCSGNHIQPLWLEWRIHMGSLSEE